MKEESKQLSKQEQIEYMLSHQPKDRFGYLEPIYRVPAGYSWSYDNGFVKDDK